MKKLLLIPLLMFSAVFSPLEVQAEPVTMVVLAPLALEAAKQLSPHAITALRSGGMQLLEICKDMGNLLRLPLGVIQATLGIPFGMLGNGLENITIGLCAPFQLLGDVLILPWSFFGGGG